MDKQHKEMLKRIRNDAIRAFGKDGANSWMNRRWRVFNNRSPIEMASSRSATKEVLDHIELLTSVDITDSGASLRNR